MMLFQLNARKWQLQTERLILRAPQSGDGAAINAAICESFAELHPWMPWARTLPTLEESEANAREGHAAFARGEEFPMRLWFSDGTFVGACGLNRGDRDVPSFDIGYWCRTSLAGRGYICEAVQALTQFAFDDFKVQRLQIFCDARNIGSRRVAEKCGFELEGILKRFKRAQDGTLADACIFARFPETAIAE